MSAFQFIFDMAENISFNKRPVVATTVARDNTVRAVSRAGDTWRFDVKMPDGIAWTTLRPYIEQAEKLDRHTSGVAVQINNAGYNSWLTAYQGNSANTTGFTASWTQGTRSLTLVNSPTTASGYKFRAGDIIQLGSNGRVYSVTDDVAYNSNTVYVNRNILDAGKTSQNPAQLKVGPAVTWRVICVQFPTWMIFARNQVAWNGSFQFFEDTQYAYS